MKPTRPTPLALAALALAASMSVQAEPMATASAQLSGVQFRLIDLDPNDGVTPGIVWNPFSNGPTSDIYQPSSLTGSFTNLVSPADGDDLLGFYQYSVNSPAQVGAKKESFNLGDGIPAGPSTEPYTATSSNGQANVSVLGVNMSATSHLDTTELASTTYKTPGGGYSTSEEWTVSQTFGGTMSGVNYDYNLGNPFISGATFSLTPKTLLLVEGRAQVSASSDPSLLQTFLNTSPAANKVVDGTTVTETGQAFASMSSNAGVFVSVGNTAAPFNSGEPGVYSYISSDQYFSIQAMSDHSNRWSSDGSFNANVLPDNDKTFLLSFSNTSDQDVTAALNVEVRTGTTVEMSQTVSQYTLVVQPPIDPPVIPPSIPEPGTWALMGLGLVSLGWATRRNRAA